MSKEQVLNRIDQEWKTFLDSFAGLSDNILLEPGVVGHWSIRDVLTHLSTWEEEAQKMLPLILEGKPTPRYTRYGGIDAFNAQEQERKRHLPLEYVKGELLTTHQRLLEFLIGVPDSMFSSKSRFYKRLKLDTYNHYREHAPQISKWRS